MKCPFPSRLRFVSGHELQPAAKDEKRVGFSRWKMCSCPDTLTLKLRLLSRIAIRLKAEAMEVVDVGQLAPVEHRHQFTVGLGTCPANQVQDLIKTTGGNVFDLLQGLQAFNHVFKPAVHISDGPVDVGAYRLRFGGLIGWLGDLWLLVSGTRLFRVLGLRLRKVDGAFTFVYSHGCLLSRRLRLGRVRC
jgi:hypothetical protein